MDDSPRLLFSVPLEYFLAENGVGGRLKCASDLCSHSDPLISSHLHLFSRSLGWEREENENLFMGKKTRVRDIVVAISRREEGFLSVTNGKYLRVGKLVFVIGAGLGCFFRSSIELWP